MDASVALFAERLQQPWLTCEPTQAAIVATFHHLVGTLQNLPPQTFFVIAANEPEATLAAVLAAVASGRCAVLGNPQWTPDQVQSAHTLLGGEQLWLTQAATDFARADVTPAGAEGAEKSRSTSPYFAIAKETQPCTGLSLRHAPGIAKGPLSANDLPGTLLIPTGGTGGHLKFAYHNWQTLSAAFDGYARFWNLHCIHCVCALPVFHIGGLMPALRTFATGGRLCLLPWKKLQLLAEEAAGHPAKQGDLPDLTAIARHWHISLVPTQVQRLLHSAGATAWLRNMQAVLVGGGASRPELLQAAATHAIPLCPAYGMTEAAATIALQRPEDFLRAQASATQEVPLGEVLPHLAAQCEPASGRIVLSGKSLFYGYFPALPQQPETYATSDRGETEGSLPQRLRVLGRLDRIVVSGGKKIDPAQVEQAICAAAHQLGAALRAVQVLGVPDPEWGERLVAFIETDAPAPTDASGPAPEVVRLEETTTTGSRAATLAADASAPPLEQGNHAALPPTGNRAATLLAALQNDVRRRLPAHAFPKQWITVSALPLDERGKPDRRRIAELTGG